MDSIEEILKQIENPEWDTVDGSGPPSNTPSHDRLKLLAAEYRRLKAEHDALKEEVGENDWKCCY
jgi:hypothetical protein